MFRSPRAAIAPALSLLLTLLSIPLPAQERSVTTDELARQSDLIVVGKVREKRAGWDARRSRIETSVTMDVEEYVKGSGARSITIVTPGGEVDGVGELYTHAARFEKDEEAVVFLRKGRGEKLRVAAGARGKESVQRNERTGERTVGGKRRFSEFLKDVQKAAARAPH
jgi:hypothetical protein